MKSVKIMNLNKAIIGDVVEIVRDDCWVISGEGLSHLFITKKTIGLVIDIRKTVLHEHKYLVVSTVFGRVFVKKGG